MALYTIDLRLRLELETPLHVGTGYGLAGYLDARVIADEASYPYVPGSSVKGRLRYYFRGLGPLLGGGLTDAEINLFGMADPRRAITEREGALFFDDLRLSPEWRNLLERAGGRQAAEGLCTSRRTNVMLSRLRGVALEQHLFTVEVVPPHLTFEGRIYGALPDEGRVVTVADRTLPRDLTLLVAACRALTHLGGRKSRGLGRCRLTIPADGLTVDGHSLAPEKLLEVLR